MTNFTLLVVDKNKLFSSRVRVHASKSRRQIEASFIICMPSNVYVKTKFEDCAIQE